ncbi:hypothetical protein DSO57_1002104 [Entomophthora muscae]|uniref:Uncharacterized protein n=1 Tax=Entomophthora muscae TaxID=34485 RepID=A0ACC2TWI5_9FUNG|nr:hypothetical protein DSO57_1002104 [Entomophthora muscae]
MKLIHALTLLVAASAMYLQKVATATEKPASLDLKEILKNKLVQESIIKYRSNMKERTKHKLTRMFRQI